LPEEASKQTTVPAAPFDSPEYNFEVKWDGIRALAVVETAGWRLWGRELADYTARYPERDLLRRLPAGTLVDGELVAFDADGRPDLRLLLRRHGLTDAWRIRQARHWCRVRYVLFDVLYHAGRCLLWEPLVRRRALLAEACQQLDGAGVQFSAGVIGAPGNGSWGSRDQTLQQASDRLLVERLVEQAADEPETVPRKPERSNCRESGDRTEMNSGRPRSPY
jgi:hypothetical protein